MQRKNYLTMGAILIKADSRNLKLIKAFAIKLEGEVIDIKDAQYVDFLLVQMMYAEKTGTTVSQAKIMNKLNPK
jgi:hypothetical protein